MTETFVRRALFGAAPSAVTAVAMLTRTPGPPFADQIVLRLSPPATPTVQRALALSEVFAPAVADVATFEPRWYASLFNPGSELDAIGRGNLQMSITSPKELTEVVPVSRTGWRLD